MDIEKSSRQYYDISFSSVEDIYDFLFRLDQIYIDAYDGNYEALVLILDFRNFIKTIKQQDLKQVLFEYFCIQTGKKPLKLNNNEDLLDNISKRLNMDKEKCSDFLLQSINQIISINKANWLQWVKKYLLYGVKREDRSKIKKPIVKDEIKNEINKVNNKQNKLNDKELPDDLKQYIIYEKYNHKKIKELKKILKTVNEEKRKIINKEIKQRIKIEIELHKDISTLKYIYKIPVKPLNKQSKTKKFSFNDEYLNVQEIYDFQDDIDIEKINIIAKEKLTNRQYLVFDLYYNLGITQQEIADITNDFRENIKKILQNSVNKIKNNL